MHRVGYALPINGHGVAMPPRASIVIPNFNNGRASARDGSRDFLGELLASLERTVGDDPELLEIVVADDGSTDDSLETARAWARRGRPNGEPFLRLIELPHCGVLSRVLNRLLAEAKGAIIARLDGDLVVRTRHWLSELCRLFDADARLGVVTGVQLLPNGRVHAFGDDLWGPRGYRHIGSGAAVDDLPPTREVDHAMGCFYATRRAVHETVGGYDEGTLRGQTEEYGVRVRLGGWKVVATRSILFEHWHVERSPRANAADRAASLDESLARFRERHGFDRLAPDLDDVRARYEGTPLWWRDLERREVPARADEWEALASDGALSQRLAEEFEFTTSAVRAASGACLVTQLGSGCGSLGVTLARAGVPFEGFERRGDASRAAEARANAMLRPNDPHPRFVGVDAFTRLPDAVDGATVDDASRPLVVLFGVLERSWNPAGVLREARRIVADRGVILMRTRLRRSLVDDPGDPHNDFTADELLALVRHVGGLETVGFEPRVTATGWLECCLERRSSEAGRGYFSHAWRHGTPRRPVGQ